MDPGRSDLTYWCLTHLFHLSDTEISKRTGLTRTTLTRYREGKIGTSHHKLAQLLRDLRDQPTPIQWDTPLKQAYRTAAYALINHALSDLPQTTDLATRIRSHLTSTPQPARSIIALCGHNPRATRRCAQRMGVKQTFHKVKGRLIAFWSLG